jgi:hypothetical protein
LNYSIPFERLPAFDAKHRTMQQPPLQQQQAMAVKITLFHRHAVVNLKTVSSIAAFNVNFSSSASPETKLNAHKPKPN